MLQERRAEEDENGDISTVVDIRDPDYFTLLVADDRAMIVNAAIEPNNTYSRFD